MVAPAGRLTEQLWRFGLVGGVGALVDYGSMLLWLVAGLSEDPARALSFLGGSTVAYLLNRRYTFASRRDTREVVAVAAVYTVTYLIILAVYAVSWRTLPVSEWTITLAWVLSQGVGTSFNFLAQRLFVFRRSSTI